MDNKFKSFSEFYPYYLSEHSNPTCRAFHFIGTSLFFVLMVYGVIYPRGYTLMLIPAVPYFFAWVGHFIFERNKPATFQYPFYSLMGDFRMYFDFLSGKLPKKLEEIKKDS